MKKLSLIALLLFVGFGSSYAQKSSAYARHLVDTLCTPFFFGRGYVNDGVTRAGLYIFQQFDSLKLKPLGNSFFQEFPMSINTFQGEMKLSINSQKLSVGRDYLPWPESGSARGKYNIAKVNLDTITLETLKSLPPKDKNTVLAVSGKAIKNSRKLLQTLVYDWSNTAPVIINSNEKLTWSLADNALNKPIFTVKESFLQNAKKMNCEVEATLNPNFFSSNICAYVPGTQYPDSFLVYTAHYDHLGGLGAKTYIAGANDNASGTAMLLSLAAHYQKHPLKYSVAFLAFSGEEIGLLGSSYFVQHPLIQLNKIKFLFNLDLMGTGADGATVVNATEFPAFFNRLKEVNQTGAYLKIINERGKAANSDHYWFSEMGVPAFFMYLLDANYTNYHDIYDVPQSLSLEKFSETEQLLIAFYQSLCEQWPEVNSQNK